MFKIDKSFDNLVFKSTERLSLSKPCRFKLTLLDDRVLVVTLIAGSLEMGLGIDYRSALEAHKEILYFEGADSELSILSERELFELMNWKLG